MNLPEFGVKRPITNLMIFLGILVIAFYCLTHLGVDLMPEIEPPVISVISSYPGASPEDVEIKVTEVLENQLATTPGLEKITSRSLEGVSVVSLKFSWGTNLDSASNDIRDRIELAKRFLPTIPDEMENPYIFKFNTALMPILFIGITGQQSYPQLYDLVDERIADPLRQIPGVGTVQLIGGLERQINIWIDRARLEGYGFSILDIQNAIRQENISQPLGSLKSGLTSYLLRLPGEFSSPEELNLVILGKSNGKTVYLKDIARIEDSFKEITMLVRHNRKNGLMMMVQKQTGANTVAVAKQVKKVLRNLEKTLPPDVKMFTIFDTSQDIINTLNTLKVTVFQAVVFVILVVWFFLRQIKTSLTIALTIPFSLFIAFIYLFLSGRTLNVISLSSLIIASGMVVDNAIVVVDNFWRHLERGKRPQEASILGTREVFLAILASTLTTVAVFLPMLLLKKSIIGIMFSELAVIVTVTLLASLFTATTFSPMLCAKIFKSYKLNNQNSKKFNKFYALSERIFRRIEDFYAKSLEFCLSHKKIIIFGFLLVFILSLFLLRFIGNEFVPEQDTGDIRITLSLPLGTRLEETDKVAKKVEDIFEKELLEKKTMFVRLGTTPSIGRAFSAAGESGEHIVMAGAKLVPKQERRSSVFEIGQVLRDRIKKIPGIIKVNVTLGNPLGRMITGFGGKAIQLEIIGHSFEETQSLAEKIKEIIEKIPGAVDVSISRDINLPELRIAIDREKMASLGLNMYTVATSLKTFIEGATSSRYRKKGKTYDIYVRLEESLRTKVEDIENLALVSPVTQRLVRLSNFAKVYEVAGPVEIERLNRERVVRVECNVSGRSTGKVKEDIEKAISQVALPSDIRINFAGDIEEQMKAFRDMFLLLLLSIVLVYMVMAGQFESLIDPLVVMFSVPFTFTGVFLGFIATSTTLNVISYLGMIMLVGIVVNNAIVLISYINILRARGYSMLEAVTLGGKERLRPVLMTTLTTLAGLLPMAISKGEGSEIWRPLGITMISGLSVSSLITLLFVPTLYTVVEARVRKGGTRGK
ncbi:MAG: efflux RND transporter permease subunit [Candidatus Omnitrophica bacterium]|nr:efflux RND transporter permease subunit [Candidatus Omnitrophota bacterium]MCM8800011.1 efflux RND transporter permease subunit [Candidatus Omnitrophota bacterium]